MKLRIRQSYVQVTGKKVRLAVKSHVFARWVDSIDPGLTIRSIEIQSVDTVRRALGEEVLFLKLKADVVDASGRRLPGIAFLRGPSVGILIVLRTPKDDYAVLIESALPAIGQSLFPQLPAGMMDKETSGLEVALRETEEETGIDPRKGKMTDLAHAFFKGRWPGIYPSPGACDEIIRLFLYEQNVSEGQIRKLQGRKTGLKEENEHLTLKVVRLEELCRETPDVKAHSAYLMYAKLKQEGKLP